MAIRCDVAVVGAGPGGYVAALRAAQLGARVVIAERDSVGGVCLNRGCIPTKTLLRTAEVLRLARDASEFGVLVDGVRLDWVAAQKRKDSVVRRLTGGVKALLDKSKVQVLYGSARFASSTLLEVSGPAGEEGIEASSFVVATGSRPAALPVPGMDGPNVLDSDGALSLEVLPGSALIIGAGPIGVEFATLFSACGVSVTLVEVLPRVLPTFDEDVSKEVERALRKARVKVLVGSRVLRVEPKGARCLVTVAKDGQETAVEVERIVSAVGRRPNVEGLGLETAGVLVEKTGIRVDDHMRSSVPHVYAVGDVKGGMLLAHVAMHEGSVAVENALEGRRSVDYSAGPSCVFSWPEVACVGLSERQAREKGYAVTCGAFPLRANGKALAQGDHDGLVKVVAETKYGQILGVHIVAAHASDLIQEGTLAIGLEATLDELEATIHPHPTLSEAVAEAVLAARGRALHI